MAVSGPGLRILPESARIGAEDEGLQLVLTGVGAREGEPDLNERASWSVEPAGALTVDAWGYVRVAEGAGVGGPIEGRARAVVGGEAVEARIAVEDRSRRGWRFGRDVSPVLTRAGCNAGGCHGRLEGWNGLRLSFQGYDAAGDYAALTRDGANRRLNPFDPERSLLLLKASGAVPHGGGVALAARSAGYRLLAEWIGAGAPFAREGGAGASEGAGNVDGNGDGDGDGDVESYTDLRIEPARIRLSGPGSQAIRVVATTAEGRERDATRLSLFRTNDDAVASIDGEGRVRLTARGETDVVARFGSRVVSARVWSPSRPEAKIDPTAWPRANFIDELVYARLAEHGLEPSPSASDAAFLRRATLDLTGQIPTPERIREYLRDPDPGKKAKLVDRLLEDRDFVLHWKLAFGDLLLISSARQGDSAATYEGWLQRKLAANAPLDGMVRELLTTRGAPGRSETAAANYALEADAKIRMELTAERFLGVRLRCAQCHDHPFDVWTRDDYYGMAAIFAKVGPRAPEEGGEGGGGMRNRVVVDVEPSATIENPRTKAAATPRPLGGSAIEAGPSEDPREGFADWLLDSSNPRFGRVTANWIWSRMFGRGLADPPDDLSAANPATHPELLEALAVHLAETGYDLRAFLRTVALSNVYGASSSPTAGNAGDSRLLSHRTPRPLSAHQLADALAQATSVPNRFPDRPARTRALQIFDPASPSPLLDTFGRCDRGDSCRPSSSSGVTLKQVLTMVGGGLVDDKVEAVNGYLDHSLELGMTSGELVENLYLRTLSRPPREEEARHWSGILDEAGVSGASAFREAAEDLFWALLNSREFAFHH